MYDYTRGSLGNMHTGSMDVGDIYAWFGGGGLFLLRALMPIVGGLLVIAFLANVMQTGFLFSSESLKFSLGKLNPVEGMKRLCSKRGFVRLSASLFKVSVILVVAGLTIRSYFPTFTVLNAAGFGQIASFVMGVTFELALKIAIALLALALLDYLYQKWQYGEDQKMTKQEVRDELKRMEGDPLTRDRRRRMQREIAFSRMMADVPEADVVITNPTEIAVALRYEAKVMNAPRVIAKGQRLTAQRIREIAEESDVPIVERKPLARALFRMCDIGDEVPVDLYQAVAEVLAFVYELNRMKAQARPAVA